MITKLKPALLALALSAGLTACGGTTDSAAPTVTKKAEGVEITLKDIEVSHDVGTMGLARARGRAAARTPASSF